MLMSKYCPPEGRRSQWVGSWKAAGPEVSVICEVGWWPWRTDTLLSPGCRWGSSLGASPSLASPPGEPALYPADSAWLSKSPPLAGPPFAADHTLVPVGAPPPPLSRPAAALCSCTSSWPQKPSRLAAMWLGLWETSSSMLPPPRHGLHLSEALGDLSLSLLTLCPAKCSSDHRLTSVLYQVLE